MHASRNIKGYLLVLVLIFGAVFFVMLTAFMGFVVTGNKTQSAAHNKARALEIAEAGLNYYKWYLAHFPTDMQNGTGLPGPYVETYTDPETGALGSFSLEVASSSMCGEVYAVDIRSTGATAEAPNLKRTVFGRYARPSVAEYAYILNANVWAGEDRTIIGPYHSNGVIRMDGTNNSTVTSGQANWQCDGSLPCSPASTGSTVNGVYGSGPNSNLWNFPAAPINFTGITVDLASMKQKAQTGGGRYIGPSGDYGYRIQFKNNGTIDVYRVDTTYNYYGYTTEEGWETERNVIDDDVFVGNYAIPANCSVIYVEDKVWLEGVVRGKVTIAAADVDTGGVDPSIILNNNITYANATSGLLAIAEQDMLVGLVVPDDMVLNGIFLAQKGRFGRNHYTSSGSEDVLSAHDSYVKRDTLTLSGTIVSNGREGTKWVSGSTWTSGFETRTNTYDRDLVADPPPMTPKTSATYQFIEWREEQ